LICCEVYDYFVGACALLANCFDFVIHVVKVCFNLDILIALVAQLPVSLAICSQAFLPHHAHSAKRGIAIVSRPSVCLSVTLRCS